MNRSTLVASRFTIVVTFPVDAKKHRQLPLKVHHPREEEGVVVWLPSKFCSQLGGLDIAKVIIRTGKGQRRPTH